MKIQKARKSDIEESFKLDKGSNKEIKWWSLMLASEFLILIKRGLVYIAKDKEKIIAYLNGNIKDNQLMLDNVYVKKEFRRNGASKKSIKIFIKDCRKLRFEEMRVDCPERLKKFYEGFEFKTTALIMNRRIR